MGEHAQGCPAPAYFAGDEKEIFINKAFSVTIGDIITTSLEGVETKHGWGLNLTDFRGNKNKSYNFAYCPWCGADIDKEKE